jgi:CheY-like chemotaxis protein
VLLLDVTMPEMDGASFLRSLRAAAIAPPHTYFISAIPADELGRLAAELDAGLVAKPFTGADLRTQLAAVLGEAEGG